MTFLLAFSSSAALVPAAFAAPPPPSAPTISPSTGYYTSVSGTIPLTISWSDSSAGPDTVNVYSSPNSFCYAGSTLISGPASVTGVSSGSAYAFSTVLTVANPSPNSAIYFCAEAIGTGGKTTGGVSEFTQVSAVTATLAPYNPTIDNGQSIVLKATPSAGAPPYTYAWYSGSLTCTGLSFASTQSVTVSPASTTQYSVKVGDQISGDTVCAYGQLPSTTGTTVTVSTAFTPAITSLTVTPGTVDSNQGATETATISWLGGTSPFTVELYTSPTPACSSMTSGLVKVGGTTPSNPTTGGSPVSFTFSQPTSTTYYCATVTDSANTPQTIYTNFASVVVNGALGAPGVAISPATVEQDDVPLTISITVTWAGGTTPYTVALYSGSNTACSSDPIPVTSAAGVAASPKVFTITTPISDVYYCAKVTDANSFSESTSTAAEFSYVTSLTEKLTLVPSAFDSGVGPSTITATVAISGGVAPYTVTLSSTACGAPTPVAVFPGFNPITDTSASSVTFTFLAPAATTTYYACASDQSGSTFSASGAVTVNSATIAVTLGLSPTDTIDQGQTTTVTATVSWTGGTSTYSVAITSGSSASCASDTTPVKVTGTASGIMASPATLTFTSPSTAGTTYFCATVTDSNPGTPQSGESTAQAFVVNPPLTASIPSPQLVTSGTAASALVDTASGGTVSYTYGDWFTGSSCTAADVITGATGNTYTPPGIIVSGSYTYSNYVTDSSIGMPTASACASATIMVDNGPTAIAANTNNNFLTSSPVNEVYVANPGTNSISVIDAVTNTVVTPTISVGTTPFGIAVGSYTSAGHPDGLIYVTNYGSATVSVLDAATQGPFATISLAAGAKPEGIAINQCLNLAYVAEYGLNQVAVIDVNPTSGTFDTVVATIPTGVGPAGVAMGTSGNNCSDPYETVFVSNYGSNTVDAIQTTPNGGGVVYHTTFVTVGSSPTAVAVDANDNVYVSVTSPASVAVFNGVTFASEASVGMPGTPGGIAIGSSNAYVAIFTSTPAVVVPVSLSGFHAGSAINLATPSGPGAAPYGVAVLGGDAYVTNSGSNIVSIISQTSNSVVATLVVP